MWRHTVDDAGEYIFLHDCTAKKIKATGNDITFHFDDGFWAIPKTKYSSFETPVRTEPSELKFVTKDINEEYINQAVYYKRGRFFWNRNREIVHYISNKEFIDKVNQKGGEFEFLYEYYYKNTIHIHGLFTSPKDKLYKAESQLTFCFEKIIYSWNDLCESKIW